MVHIPRATRLFKFFLTLNRRAEDYRTSQRKAPREGGAQTGHGTGEASLGLKARAEPHREEHICSGKEEGRESDAEHMVLERDTKEDEAERWGGLRSAQQRKMLLTTGRRAGERTGRCRQGAEESEGLGHGHRDSRSKKESKLTKSQNVTRGKEPELQGEKGGGGAVGHHGQPEDEPALLLRQNMN